MSKKLNIKNIFYLACLMLLIINIVQNFTLMHVSLLLWEITMPRSLILLIVFGFGIVCGYGLMGLSHGRNIKSSTGSKSTRQQTRKQ